MMIMMMMAQVSLRWWEAVDAGVLGAPTTSTARDRASQAGSSLPTTLNTTRRVSGRFFSPNYPQHYPSDTRCQYAFFGKTSERVKITFQNFSLEHVDGRQALRYPCYLSAIIFSSFLRFCDHSFLDLAIEKERECVCACVCVCVCVCVGVHSEQYNE